MEERFGRFIVACNEGTKGIGTKAEKIGLLWAGQACILVVDNDPEDPDNSVVSLWEATREAESFGAAFKPEPPGGGLWVATLIEPMEWDEDEDAPSEVTLVKWRRPEVGEVEDLARGKAPWGRLA